MGNKTEPCNANITYKLRINFTIDDRDLCKLEVEVLINRVKYATDGQVILELYNDFLAYERLEKALE